MTRYSFSKDPLEKNDYYRKFTRKKFWSGFLTTTGATAVSGLLIDVFFTGVGLGTFPVITAAFSIVGIPFGILVAGSNYLLDNTGKTGVFFSKHLLEMEKISFKYHFKYGSLAFNLKALDYVRFESIEEKRNLK
jgi:hypothetical protein